MWNIDNIVKKGKYLYAVVKNHPRSSSKGYVLLHRVVMENSMGRILDINEVVHHINHNTHDNSIDNLQLMTRSEHSSHHAKKGRSFVSLSCPNCGMEFEREKRNIKPNTTPKCSRKCNGEYSRKLQLNTA